MTIPPYDWCPSEHEETDDCPLPWCVNDPGHEGKHKCHLCEREWTL